MSQCLYFHSILYVIVKASTGTYFWTLFTKFVCFFLHKINTKSMCLWKGYLIKTHGSELRGQEGSSRRHTDRLETHAREYYTGTRVVKIENAITKKP